MELTSQGTVHLKSMNETETAGIVQNEQSLDFQEHEAYGNGVVSIIVQLVT